jgi:hypothetical protein
MNESEFREAMRSGLGRAIAYARENDVEPFREAILDACLHCYSVDPQSEGTRALYMFELVNLAPDREFYCGEVLKSLSGCADNWDAVQRFRFASYMAMDGDDRARRAMYKEFNPGPRMVEMTAVDFVEMDGLEGFLFAAEKVGALLLAWPDDVDEGALLWHATERFGEDQSLSVLRQAAQSNPRLEAYRVAAQAHCEKSAAHKSREIITLPYAEFKERRSEAGGYWLSRWGEQATAEDLELAAHDLLAARTPEVCVTYLRIFSRRPFPLETDYLLKLAASDDERVSIAAAGALANIAHPAARQFAFHLVESHRSGREHAISILARNSEPGDHEIVLDWFAKEEDRAIRHRLGLDLRKFWKRHPEPVGEIRMLLTLYEKGPCSVCREFLLSRLIELNSLPRSIRTECANDANVEVRRLAEHQERRGR